jgi:ubiquitin C-terminal hydrolase
MDKYKDKGLTGLQNLGNTCFINSILQCLSHTYEIHDLLQDQQYYSKLSKCYDTLLLVEYDKLLQLMWAKNCKICPKAFLTAIQKVAHKQNNELFTGYDQNDASEFLIFILNCFHNALKREVEIEVKGVVKNEKDNLAKVCYERFKTLQEKEYSEIINIFYGIQITQIYEFNTCNSLSNSAEPYFITHLPIPKKKNINIYDCYDLLTCKEDLIGDNAWLNNKNEKQDVQKSMLFWSLPSVLIIDFKRFDYNGRKTQSLITFPLDELDLSKYVVGYNSNNCKYECYGIINHSGNTMGGHYTAFVKNINGKWYHYNDMMVNEISEKKVISSKAYCLFYRKINKI